MHRPLIPLLAIAALLAGGCGAEFLNDALDDFSPFTWQRHTIDDTRRGADGARLGDADNDGLADVVTGWEQSGRVVLYLNPGPGAVDTWWPRVVVGEVGSVEDALLFDLDGDGFQDVISSAEGGTRSIFVHWSPGNVDELLDASAWQTEKLPAADGAREWMFAAPADVDGDGRVDLIAGAKGGNGAIGYFRAPEERRALQAWQWVRLADAGWIMSIVPYDLDADGDLDIVYSDRTGDDAGIYWLQNRPAERLWVRQVIDQPARAPMFLDVFSVDGVPQIVAALDARRLRRLQPLGPGALLWVGTTIDLSDSYGTAKGVRVADVDLDGALDVVFSCENAGGGRFGVGMLALDGTRSVLGPQPISPTTGEKYDLVQLLDLDLDGDLDVLTTEEDDGLGVVWFENPAR